MIVWIAKIARWPHAEAWIAMTIQLMVVTLFFGCESQVIIEDVDRPFGVVRAAVKESLPGGIRKTSDNGREFDSNYFAPKGPLDVDGSAGNFRETAHIKILGAGRPYSITIDATIEKKTPRSYENYGRDPGRAKEIETRVRTGLSKRRDDRNMIDDFKPF